MDFLKLLGERPLVVMDGAMGTRLIELGLEAGECGDLWNLERPEDIEGILRSYVEAGADCVLSNTFGANGVALRRHGLEDRMEGINAAGVEIARRAGGEGVCVFGGLGPTGGMLAPLGDLEETEVVDCYARQTETLAGAGADAILCETFESADEIALALRGARQGCDLPLVASMKFNREPSGRYRTMMGEGPERLVEAAEEADCAAAGTNCGKGIADMVPLLQKMASLTEIPLFVEPNAGMPQLRQGETTYDEAPSVFEEFVPRLYRAGARIIGGCCGTTPDHIRVIRRFADSL